MASNEVSPTSPFAAGGKSFYPPKGNNKGGNKNNKSGNASGTGANPTNPYDFSKIAASLTNESATYSRNNPPFMYPGPGVRIAAHKEINQIKRGYIRRLTEFYDRLKANDTQPDNPSTLQNLRCNFQFNPANITRSVEQNSNMQNFFNQEPSQLTQPIPGNAGFAFELLFNREAELHSGKYIGPDGKEQRGSRSNRLSQNPEYFINETYNPAWVTEIGVLADIMILDDIVGQGLAKDIVQNIVQGSLSFAEVNNDAENKDEEDKQDTEAASAWDPNRLREFTTNLGNKAFLAPTPVRILFSPWFMVEGFVMSYSVTFNKFTPEMIPSQAIVAIQLQALYVGFAQQKTLLTDMPDLAPPGDGSGFPDVPPAGTTKRDQYDTTIAALSTYVARAAHLQGANGAGTINGYFFAKDNLEQEINFIGLVSNAGTAFYDGIAKQPNGGGLSFTVKGEIKIWWHSHVSNATNQRGTTNIAAVTSGGIVYASGPPPTEAGTDYAKLYGTSSNPFVATLDEIDVYYEQGIRFGGPDYLSQLLILGQIRLYQYLRVYPDSPTASWGFDRSSPFSAGTPAIWKWNIEKGARIPFKQDKFNVSLELTLTAKRFEQTIESPQKIHGFWGGITAHQDNESDQVLFNGITPKKVPGVPPAVRGNQ